MKTYSEILQMVKELDAKAELAGDPNTAGIYSAMSIALAAVISENAAPCLTRLMRAMDRMEHDLALRN